MTRIDAIKMTDVTLTAIFIDGVEVPVDNLEQAIRAVLKNRPTSNFIEHFIVQANGTPDRALLSINWDANDRDGSNAVLTPHCHSRADFGLPEFGAYQFPLSADHYQY